MTRDELLDALDYDQPAHRACRQALLQGAELTVWEGGVSTASLTSTYRRRERHARQVSQPTIGLSETVGQLAAYERAVVRLAKVTAQDSPWTFVLFLAVDGPAVIACTGVGKSR